MKVWELIAELMKRPAGDEVLICGPSVLWSEIDTVEDIDKGQVGITACEFTVVNEEDGSEVGKLSELEF